MSTAQTLDEVNRRFYARFADAFDQSRHHGWRGWHDLLPLLPDRPLRILDLGCGNGRLAEFMDRTVERPESIELYLGKDRCQSLLDHARMKSVSFPTTFETWSWFDEVEDDSKSRVSQAQYDWVALFGVMHHVYGYSARLNLLKWAAQWLRPGGLLSVSLWNFGASEQFMKKTIPWGDMAGQWGLDESTLEDGDYLLGWSGHRDTPRYCHWVSPDEEARLESDLARVGPSGLGPMIRTGSPDDLNRYRSWRLMA